MTGAELVALFDPSEADMLALIAAATGPSEPTQIAQERRDTPGRYGPTISAPEALTEPHRGVS